MVKELKTKLLEAMKLFMAQEEPIEKTQEVEIKLSGETSSKIYSPDELKVSGEEVGASVQIIDADGNSQPAPDGAYEMESGLKFTCKDGIITSIDSEYQLIPREEETLAETAPEAAPEADKLSQLEDRMKAIEDAVKAIQDAQLKAPVAASKEDVDAFAKQIQTLSDSIKTLALTPAEFSKTSTSNVVKDSKEQKMEALAKIFANK